LEPRSRNRRPSSLRRGAPLLAALVFLLAPDAGAETPTFERVDRVDLNSGETQLFSGVITPDGARGLFGSAQTNEPIYEVDLDTMERVQAITTPANLGFDAAVIDPAGDFAYFGTGGLSVPRISRIALADGALVAGTQQSDSTVKPGAATIDPDGRYAYFAENGSTHRIFRYRLFDDGSGDGVERQHADVARRRDLLRVGRHRSGRSLRLLRDREHQHESGPGRAHRGP